tara:strand:- start:2774 stop:3793 length:1020 start_codon:yes stop_codon:yes gene_type:complete
MSNNTPNTLSNALDILVNGPSDPSSNIIPSAPAVFINTPNTYIPLFNPDALTINIPTQENTQEERETQHEENQELLQDNDTDDETTDSDNEHTLMPPPSRLYTQTLLQGRGRRFHMMRAASHHINQTVSHAIESTNRSEPGRSTDISQNNETRECGICYNQIDIDKIVNTRCNHQFCNKCFFRWMRGNVTCPMCREDFTSWRNHSRDNINDDIIAVTEMFNSTLREHVHLNRLNTNTLKDIAELKKQKALIQKSLVSSRDLIDYNRGYAVGLSSIKQPKQKNSESYDKGLIDGYQEFRTIVKKEKSKKPYITNKNNTKNNKSFKFKLTQPIFEFKGFNP